MTATTAQKTFLGHPRGLYVLFFTEMWERFNYYGMRALLILYMVNYFKWPQEHASSVYKWFTGLVYLTPLIGGFLADRYLGNRWAIILGAATMAAGQFCMAVPDQQFFYVALGLLIVGNGLFKPNMSTQVGRLYPPNDPRRDSAYTIFYMGVNLGAFIAPIVCAELRENTAWGFRAGFLAAGIGMLLGLVIYLLGYRWVAEVPQPLPGGAARPVDQSKSAHPAAMTEKEASEAASIIPAVARHSPGLMLLLAVLVVLVPWSLVGLDVLKTNDAIAYSGGGGVACIMGWYILSRVSMAARDRVLAIYVVGLFVIFFWGAFEQAGNAMNLFADKVTNRYVTEPMPEPSVFPESVSAPSEGAAVPAQGAWAKWVGLWNPVKTEWFQSINAAAIFVFAPLFAWLWVWLPKKGIRLSIPAKIAIGVFLQGMAFALMTWAIRYESQLSSAPLAALPPGVTVDAENRVIFRDAPDLKGKESVEEFALGQVDPRHPKVVQGRRIVFDAAAAHLRMNGVLADTDRDRLLRASVSPAYLAKIRQLALDSERAKREARGAPFTVQVVLDETPPGFDLRYAGLPADAVTFDEATSTLTTTVELGDRDYKALLVAGADAAFRDALNKLYVDSAKFKLSWSWLTWFFIISTFGELCLSPVGLSMVSKLAPASYATMMMGMWYVMIFFGNYTAGQLGEIYGTIDPGRYFATIGGALMVASFICFLLVKRIRAMMHGVM